VARKKNTRSAQSFISREINREVDKAPVPASRETAAFVRLAHPDKYGFYFNKHDAIVPWVEHGYTRWTILEWEGSFGAGVTSGEDTRKWEFFGYTIPLYFDTKT
jgi:hypothetical protein